MKDFTVYSYVNWKGSSGIQYRFEVLQAGNEPTELPGIYILSKATREGCEAIYIGQAIDMKRRLRNHEKLRPALQLGVNEIHLMLAPADDEVRKSIESDLISRWQPPLNHKG
ncbi:GIY-YIG nuclease family protein [Gellertiella hungarica]|uniref:Excinuclease UvrABC nuclease subunit n=1 Tax=Gellertiella hungarica TaxID=1572859 RepID=A0A7W6NJ42_9HYPH|nr:GIY-YIG nuclease family protein [Gellertiella hungarica]MBB4063353.1 excinuclease UvrABC nuclease subunit [Gellertiella hungarica]